MALFDFLKPKWQRSDPQSRVAGIAELQDETILVGLAEKDPDNSVRDAALRRLDEVRPKWQHSQADVRRQAVGKLKDQKVLNKLAQSDPDRSVQEEALRRLDEVRPKWQHSKPDVRKEAIATLNDQSVLKKLMENDPDESVRQAASERFGHARLNSFKRLSTSGDPEADIDALLKMAQSDPKADLAAAAKSRLVELVIEALFDKEGSGGFRVNKQTGMPMVNIQRLALATAARFADERLVEPLLKVLKTQGLQDQYVGSEAILALAKQGDRRAVPVIADAVKNDYSTGLGLDGARALAQIGDPEGIKIAAEAGFVHENPEINGIIEEVCDYRALSILHEGDIWDYKQDEQYATLKARHEALWKHLRETNDPKVVKLLIQRFDEYQRTSGSHDSVIRERLTSLGPMAREPLKHAIKHGYLGGTYESILRDVLASI